MVEAFTQMSQKSEHEMKAVMIEGLVIRPSRPSFTNADMQTESKVLNENGVQVDIIK